MLKWSKVTLSMVLLLSLSASMPAQNAQLIANPRETRQVTAAVARESIRFASLGEMIQMRLEVVGTSGEMLFDSDFKPGNLIDWPGFDKQGQRLADGTYLCVVTVKDSQGQTTRKHAVVSLQDHSLSLKQSESSLLTAAQAQAAGSIEDVGLIVLEPRESLTTAVIAHDGGQAHLVSGSGGLSISSGDFFANKVLEHMRLTAEGNVGIGISNPQAKLDVAGTIRASEGIVFPDGSIQYSASRKTFGAASLKPGQSVQGQDVPLVPDISGTGTTGRISKWLDGPNGVLNDSNITEVSGAIGINGTPSTSFRLDVNGSTRIRGSNPGFNLDGLRAAGNTWLFQTVDDDGRFRLFGQDNLNPGVERLTIGLSTGNVGIGATSPAARLHVFGTSNGITAPIGILESTGSQIPLSFRINGTEQARIRSDSDGDLVFATLNGGSKNIRFRAGDDSTSDMFIQSSTGNVGIGTLAPGARLDVLGAINTSTGYNLAGNPILGVGGASVGNTFLGFGAGSAISPLADNNSFFGNGAGQSTTIAGGNSFFGTNAGRANQTGGENAFFGSRAGEANTTGDSNSFFGVGAGDSNTTGDDNSFFGRAAGATNGAGTRNSFFGMRAGLANQTGANNSFVGFEAGDSNTTGGNNTIIGAGANVGSGNLSFATAVGAGATVSNSNTVVLGRSSDKVLIKGDLDLDGSVLGNLNVTSTLTVDSDSFLFLALGASGNADVCYDISSRRVTVCSSSLRYKTNVQTFNSGIDLIKRLRPVTFNWKSDNKADLGLIAEEVNEIEPLLVVHDDKGKIESVKYRQVGVVLVNAVNEQQAQIESHQDQLHEQLNYNVALQKQLDDQTELIKRLQSQIDVLTTLIHARNPAAQPVRARRK